MTMNDDIKDFGVYGLTHNGELVLLDVHSTDDYNHYTHQLHHYIKQQEWNRNREWFNVHDIRQKLILLPVYLHEAVHNQGIKNLTDEEFEQKFKISRWDLVFNRRFTKY